MLLRLGAEIVRIDVAVLAAKNRHDFEPGHRRAGGVGAVGGLRDEADVAAPLAPTLVVAAHGKQPGVFPGGPGVGLERDRGETGDFRQPFFQFAEKLRVALRLLQRRERVELGKQGPREREHFARGVELHRAGAERNHRGRQ